MTASTLEKAKFCLPGLGREALEEMATKLSK
jgi:hypothetical protein